MVQFVNEIRADYKFIFNYKRTFQARILKGLFYFMAVVTRKIDRNKVCENFKYIDGKLFYLKNRQKRFVGKRAGQLNGGRGDYWVVYMNAIPYLEHRVIYTMLKGEIPDGYEIDHKDNNGLNNKIENLRIATKAQNSHNKRKLKTNTTGYKGVVYIPSIKRWKAQMSIGKSNKSFGLFDTPEKAYDAYKQGFIKIRGAEFWNEG